MSPRSLIGVLESWQNGCGQVALVLASPMGGLWERRSGGVLEVMIILFVNNHLLLSDPGSERQGRISREAVIDMTPPWLARVPHKRYPCWWPAMKKNRDAFQKWKQCNLLKGCRWQTRWGDEWSKSVTSATPTFPLLTFQQ